MRYSRLAYSAVIDRTPDVLLQVIRLKRHVETEGSLHTCYKQYNFGIGQRPVTSCVWEGNRALCCLSMLMWRSWALLRSCNEYSTLGCLGCLLCTLITVSLFVGTYTMKSSSKFKCRTPSPFPYDKPNSQRRLRVKMWRSRLWNFTKVSHEIYAVTVHRQRWKLRLSGKNKCKLLLLLLLL